MDSDRSSMAFIEGFGFATVFWVCVMLMFVDIAYDHGKHVGKLESLVQAESQNRSSENEN